MNKPLLTGLTFSGYIVAVALLSTAGTLSAGKTLFALKVPSVTTAKGQSELSWYFSPGIASGKAGTVVSADIVLDPVGAPARTASATLKPDKSIKGLAVTPSPACLAPTIATDPKASTVTITCRLAGGGSANSAPVLAGMTYTMGTPGTNAIALTAAVTDASGLSLPARRIGTHYAVSLP